MQNCFWELNLGKRGGEIRAPRRPYFNFLVIKFNFQEQVLRISIEDESMEIGELVNSCNDSNDQTMEKVYFIIFTFYFGIELKLAAKENT